MSVLHIKDENGNWVPVTTIQGDPGHSPVITATKNGTTTTILSDGVAIATINDGAEGVDGQDAAPLTITSQSLDDNGNRVVVFSDGTSVTIPKGQQGSSATATDVQINGTSIVSDGVANIPLAKLGIVRQNQVWVSNDNVQSYSINNIVWGWIPIAFINTIEAEGAIFNETSGYFELNEIIDISYQEAVAIFNKTNCVLDGQYLREKLYSVSNCRTNIPPKYHNAARLSNSSREDMFACFLNSSFEVINLDNGFFTPSSVTSLFSSCLKLRKIIGVLDFSAITTDTSTFAACRTLEYVMIKSLGVSLNMSSCKMLNAQSVEYMINNCNQSKSITIKLHSTAYARAIANSDVQTALANHTNVTLVSA